MGKCGYCQYETKHQVQWLRDRAATNDITSVYVVAHQFADIVIHEHENKNRALNIDYEICSTNHHANIVFVDDPNVNDHRPPGTTNYTYNLYGIYDLFERFNQETNNAIRARMIPNMSSNLFKNSDIEAMYSKLNNTATKDMVHSTINDVSIV